jgi:hypothetical protein
MARAVNGQKYFSEGFINVANGTTTEKQAAPSEASEKPIRRHADDWVARILEIRASDEHHVYARVYWMYWPDELWPNTLDGKKHVKGRQWYHGKNELIASNHSKSERAGESRLSALLTFVSGHNQCG